MGIIEQIKEQIFLLDFSTVITEETSTSLKFHETGLDQFSKFEFEVSISEGTFYAKELFDNPADYWEIEYHTEGDFLVRLVELQ